MESKGLHNLAPAPGATRDRKRVGRGPASGTGKTSGRGTKGQKARSGSHNMRPGFEGGQMPIYMRVGKLRGSTKKMSMPMGPFRTHTQPVNVSRLVGFSAGTEVTPELLRERGILTSLKHPVKILGDGDIAVALKLRVHQISASARAKVEAAGGTIELIESTVQPAPSARARAKARRAAASTDGRRGGSPATGAPAKPAGATADAEPATDG